MIHHESISTYISALTVSLALLMCASGATAQSRKGNGKSRSAAEVADTVPLFRGFAVAVDLVGPAQLMLSDYGQYEASLRINLKDKYFPIVELGYGKANHLNDMTDISYKTSAPYGRIGMDFNVLKNKHDDYRLYAGARLAMTSFKYDLSKPPLTDPVWKEEVPYTASDVKCSYAWIEALLGVDAKIWGPVHLGWSVRYRSRVSYDVGDYGNCWYVPGFGKAGSSRLGGTFNISIDI